MNEQMPLDIDVIEVVYAEGEVSVGMLLLMAGDAARAWSAVGRLTTAGSAALWVVAEGAERRREAWEVAVVLRNRLKGSVEPTARDEEMRLRATDKTGEAYARDFGEYYERGLG